MKLSGVVALGALALPQAVTAWGGTPAREPVHSAPS